jgi:hypothetical protein
MLRQCRSPCVEHGGDADTCTEMTGVGGDGEHGLGGHPEQQVINHRLVVQGDVGNLGGDREDHVEVADRQQVGLACGEPFACRCALALWAVPVPAAVVGDAAVAAVLAAPNDAAVVTVGVLQAGTKENVIPDEAIIKLNVRTFDAGVREHVLGAIERIVNAEAEASGAPRMPEITPLDRYPLNVNDETASIRIAEAFRGYFPSDRVKHTGPAPASEDFGCFGTAWQVPSVFWFVGGNDPEIYAKARAAGKLNELPVNHSPQFAPILHPTLETGVEALVVGALAWLGAS